MRTFTLSVTFGDSRSPSGAIAPPPPAGGVFPKVGVFYRLNVFELEIPAAVVEILKTGQKQEGSAVTADKKENHIAKLRGVKTNPRFAGRSICQ